MPLNKGLVLMLGMMRMGVVPSTRFSYQREMIGLSVPLVMSAEPIG